MGIGDWAQSPIPNPHFFYNFNFFYIYLKKLIKINDEFRRKIK